MKRQSIFRYRHLLLGIACLLMGVAVKAQGLQTTRYVNSVPYFQSGTFTLIWGNDNAGNDCTNPNSPCLSMSKVMAEAVAGDSVVIGSGPYSLTAPLLIDKPLIVQGNPGLLPGVPVILDVTAITSGAWPIYINSANVTMRDLIVQAPSYSGSGVKPGYTIHTYSPNSGGASNIKLENITVNNAYKTPFDIHGGDNITLKNLSASNVVAGNGVQFSGVHHATLDGFTGTNNAWGSIAVYVSTTVGRGSDDVVINGSNLNIDGRIYQEDDATYTNTNSGVTGWDYNVRNADHRSGGGFFTFYSDDLSTASALALALQVAPNDVNTSSVIQNKNTGTWEVINGLSINKAATYAAPGGLVHVASGTYTDAITINKNLTLNGPNAGVAGTGTRGAEAVISNAKMTVGGGAITVDGFTFSSTLAASNQTALLAQNTGTLNIVNNIFDRNAPGSSNSNQSLRGIEMSVKTSGTTNIEHNKFTGSASGIYQNVSWQSGIYSNGGTGITIQNNTFENCRAALNMDDFAAGQTITGNTFTSNATQISFGGVTPTNGQFTISGNEFAVNPGGATLFNLSNVNPAFTLDATNNTYSGVAPTAMTNDQKFAAEANMYHRGMSGRNGVVNYIPGQQVLVPANNNIGKAVSAASNGDEILFAPGNYTITSQVAANKPLTFNGVSNASVSINGDYAGYFMLVTGAGTTIKNLSFAKTGHATGQNMIGIQAANATITDCAFTGQYTIGGSEVSRAVELSSTGLTFSNNTVSGLRQPGYMNPIGTGVISNNTISGSKGWVVDGANLTFTGNTFTGNVEDIAILAGTNAALYTDLLGISNANGNAFLDDQRTTPATMGAAVAYVDAVNGNNSNTGLQGSPYQTIQTGVDRILPYGTVSVFPGAYNETAPSRTIQNGTSGYQFGVHVPYTKHHVTIRGIDASGNAITNLSDVAAVVTTNATNNFGYSGFFIEGANTTIQGIEIGNNLPSNDKSLEVTASGFTAHNVKFNANPATDAEGLSGSLYFTKWNQDVDAFDVSGNSFNNYAISISSGTGLNGASSTRVISGNTLNNSRIDFNGESASTGGPAWYALQVGGAQITGNTFTGSNEQNVYVRRRGTLTSGTNINFNTVLASNTFGKTVVIYDASSNSQPYSYTASGYTFASNEAIFTKIQPALDVAPAGSFVRPSAGTYNEEIAITKAITLDGGNATTTIIKGGMNPVSQTTVSMAASNATLKNVTVTRDYGTTVSDWYASTNNTGITINQTVSGTTIDHVIVKGNRNGIYGQICPNTTVKNSIIENNRTGFNIGRDFSGSHIQNNIIRNNFTHGIVFNADFGAPVVLANTVISENSFSGNWYCQMSYQNNTNQTIAPSDVAGFSASCNWFGTATPSAQAVPTTEPGYGAQVPSQFGGTAPNPFLPANGQIAGLGANLINFTALVNGSNGASESNGFVPSGSCLSATKLATASCGKQDYLNTDVMTADAVGGASSYEFQFLQMNNTVMGSVVSNTTGVALNAAGAPALTPGSQYKIKVRAMISGIWGPYGDACTIGIYVPSSTQLASGSCGKTDYLAGGTVSADPVANATSYDFQVSDAAGSTVLGTVTSASNSFDLSSVSFAALTPGTQFSVKVRATANNTVGAYGSACTIGMFKPAPVDLVSGDCNNLQFLAGQSINTVVVPNTSKYRFEFYDMSNNLLGTYNRTVNSLVLNSSIPFLTPGQHYKVVTTVRVNDIWSDNGSGCTIGMFKPDAITLQNSDCGKMDFFRTESITANTLSGATKYQFEFSASGSVLGEILRSTPNLPFNTSLITFPVNPGSQFSVRVKAFVDGVWGDYGSACTIGIANPLTQLQTSDCGRMDFLSTDAVTADVVTDATAYQFEFSDATGTNVLGVISRSVNSVLLKPSSLLFSVNPGDQLRVRVRTKIGGVYGDYGSSCTIGFYKPGTTALAGADCGKTDFFRTESITATAVSDATSYQFDFSTLANAPLGTVSSASNSLLLSTSNVPFITVGDQVKVRVRVVAKGITGDYGSTCTIGLYKPATTALQSADCGNLDFLNTESITATPVSGATSYVFSFTKSGSVVGVVTSASNVLALNAPEVTFAVNAGDRFSVKVKAVANGVEGLYGSACGIGIHQTGTTKLNSTYCGNTSLLLTNAIKANSVANATNYEFEFTRGGTVVGSVAVNSNTLSLSSSDINFVIYAGDQFSVRVRAMARTVWGDFGDACTIGIALPKLANASCGATNLTSSRTITANAYSNATTYFFNITEGGSNVLGGPISKSTNTLALNEFGLGAVLQPGHTYQVQVAVMVGSVVSSFGSSCDITMQGSGGRSAEPVAEIAETPIEMTIYPNPVSEVLNIELTLNGEARVVVQDVTGKIISQKTITGSGTTKETINVSALTPGNYILGVVSKEGVVYKQFVRK